MGEARYLSDEKQSAKPKGNIVFRVPYLNELSDDGYTLYSALLHSDKPNKFNNGLLTDISAMKLFAYAFSEGKKDDIENQDMNWLQHQSMGVYIIPSIRFQKVSKIFQDDMIYYYDLCTRNIEQFLVANLGELNQHIFMDIQNMTECQNIQLLVYLEQFNNADKSISNQEIKYEVGCIGQNIKLVGGMLGLRVITLGKKVENYLDEYLQGKGKNHTVKTVFAIG